MFLVSWFLVHLFLYRSVQRFLWLVVDCLLTPCVIGTIVGDVPYHEERVMDPNAAYRDLIEFVEVAS